MEPTACPDEHELLARALGTAIAGANPPLDAHLAECAECRMVVSELAREARAESLADGYATTLASAGEAARTPNRPVRARVASQPDPNATEGAVPHVVAGELIDGKYRVERVLGTGGMGIVLGATHEVLGTRVAIKVPALASHDDDEVRARLLREARTVARLVGDYVGRVLDAGVLRDGFPFVVFELLEGRTLAERLRDDGRLDARGAVDAVLEACAGLAEAHAVGVVHRDVKPSNLFETRRADGTFRVRVIDFGIAKTVGEGRHDATRSGMVLGTPAYMAPEQMVAASSRAVTTADAAVVDGRADVWALGMTLVELVTARAPTVSSFAATRDDEGNATARAFVEAGATRRDGVAIARIVARCLRESPDDRFPSVAALAVALVPFAGPRGRAAVATIDGAPRPGRARGWLLRIAAPSSVAALAVAIGAGAALVVWPAAHDPRASAVPVAPIAPVSEEHVLLAPEAPQPAPLRAADDVSPEALLHAAPPIPSAFAPSRVAPSVGLRSGLIAVHREPPAPHASAATNGAMPATAITVPPAVNDVAKPARDEHGLDDRK